MKNKIKNFDEFINEELHIIYINEELEKGEDDPCWDGYVQLGMKKKDGKEVPNCVPIDEVNESSEYLFEGEPVVPMLQKMAKKSKDEEEFIEKALQRFRRKLKDGPENRKWLKWIYQETK